MNQQQRFYRHWHLWLALLLVSAAACMCPTTTTLVETAQTSNIPPLEDYGIERDNALVLLASEPESLDPALWDSSADGYIGDVFSGLVRLGTDLRVIPDLAESWDITPDGLVYTFALRRGVTFHNGHSFTADDVVFSWERALDPSLGSDTAATYLNDIDGADEVAAGRTSTLSGLEVLDDYTLQVTLDAPKPYFLYKLAYPVAWIVDPESVDDIETNPQGTGPFMLDRHEEDQIFILRRNPDYYLGPVALEYVVYRIFAGSPIRLYELNETDVVGINLELVARAQDLNDPLYGNVQTANGFCTTWLAFDQAQPPFEDPLVRRAFALSFHEERYNDVVYEGTGVLAVGLYPPGLPGYTLDVAGLHYDPDAARQALQESTYRAVDNLPEIIYATVGSGGNIDPSDALFIQMFEETLGLTITLDTLDYSSFSDQLHAGIHGQLVPWGWCADYPDPETFADLFYTGSQQNVGHYSNPEVDALIDQARIEPGAEPRLHLYREVERLLIEDAAVILTSHSRPYYVVTKPYVRGYVATAIGVAQHMNVSIVPDE